MAVNQNRNSVRALRTTSVGHIAHKNIPNLSIGGGGDFTIQLWVLKGRDIDGLLYGQEGGFSISLADGVVVFSLNGFATLSSGTDWTLPPHRQDYITLRHQSGVLTLFLGGIPIAEKTVSAKAPACAGDYFIGKQFTGGFPLIRVSNTARSDEDILADNAAPPAVDSHCVFQSDCSTVQYKDVSANRLAMWTVGEGAGCGIYTACTAFSGKGQVSCDPMLKLPAVHTLLLKLWPREQQKDQVVYTAMDGEKTLYTVELTAQSDHTFRLCVAGGAGARATLSKALLPELWQDVAAVFQNGKVTLFLDGKRDGAYPLALSGSRSTVLVGSEYEQGRPVFEKGFWGYVAYTAEFGKALSADEIAMYADDPPFMFEEDLVSLLPLDWADEVESVGATPLSTIGSASFQLAADTTPFKGDIGVSMRLPTKVSPKWESLSADEQWTLTLLEDLLRATMTNLYGYPGDQPKRGKEVPLAQGSPDVFKYHNDHLYHRVREMSPCPSEAQVRHMGMELTVNGGGKISAAMGGVHAAGMGTTTAAGAGGIVGFVQSHAGAIVAGAFAVATVVIAALAAALLGGEGKRPPGQGSLSIKGICWDHNGDPSRGGLHYHEGGDDLPASMTDAPGIMRLDTRCVLVPGKLAGASVDVTISYTGSEPVKSGTLYAYDLTAGKLLGDQSVSYTIPAGGTLTLSMPFDTSRLPAGMHKLTNTWQFRDDAQHIINCKCTIYLLPELPISPWVTDIGLAYSTHEPGYIRTEFLDYFLPTEAQPTDFAAWMTRRLNTGGFVYDVAGGGDCHYTDYLTHTFYLDLFLKDAQKKGKVLNCADCAHIVSTACAAVGRSLPVVRFIPPWGSQGFGCNRIIAIGTTPWRFPFDTTGKAPGGGFSYHMFNVDGESLSSDTPIYDACLQVDKGDYPGGDGSKGKKDPVLPAGMPATDGDSFQINIVEPYKGNFYRERLVVNGHYCYFEQGSLAYVSGFGAPKQAAPTAPEGYITAVMEMFSLAPTPEEAALPRMTRESWSPKTAPGMTLLWEGPDGHARWMWESSGGPCQVRYWHCSTAEETAARMAAVVAGFTHPDKRLGEELGVTVGERRVVIGGTQIVFSRLGHVFSVGGESLETALAAAGELDQSIQAG